MKKTFKFFFLLIFLTTQVKGQDFFLIDNRPLTPDFLDSVATNLNVVDITKSREICEILKLDIFDYFQLGRKYDTELKKKVFMESDEYKEYLKKIKQEKSKIENSFFYIQINPLFKCHSYQKGEYSIKDKGFYIKTCWNMDYDFPHKIDKNYIYFKALPSKLKTETYFGETSKWEEFFIPLSESDGINIENDSNNCSYIVIFKINGLETVRWDNVFADWKITLPRVNKLRLVILNNKTQKIYFDKIYMEMVQRKGTKRR